MAMEETLKLELRSDASRGKHWHGKCVNRECGQPILLPDAVFHEFDNVRWDPARFVCWYCPQQYDSPQESDDKKECCFRVVPPKSGSQPPAGASSVVPHSPAPAPIENGVAEAREAGDNTVEQPQANAVDADASDDEQIIASRKGDGNSSKREESVLPTTIDTIHAALRTVSDTALNSVAVAEERARRLDEVLSASLASLRQTLESLVQETKSTGDEARQSINVAKTGAAELESRIVKTMNEWSVAASSSKSHYDQVLEQNLGKIRDKIDNFFHAIENQTRGAQRMIEGVEKAAERQQKKTSERERSTSDYLADLKEMAAANHKTIVIWLNSIHKYARRLADAMEEEDKGSGAGAGGEAAAGAGAAPASNQVAATIAPSTLDSQTVSPNPTSNLGLAAAGPAATRGPALGLLQDQALLAQTVRDAIHETLLAPNAIVDVLRRVHEFRLPELNPGRDRIPEDLPNLFDIVENEWISWNDPRRPVASDELRRAVVRLLKNMRMAIESWHQSHGIARFGEPGERYDYAIHELASTVTTSESTMADRIKEVVSSGYRLSEGDRMLKKARVVVWVLPRETSLTG